MVTVYGSVSESRFFAARCPVLSGYNDMDSNSANEITLPEQQELLAELNASREESFAQFFQQAKQRLHRIVRFRLDYRLRGRVAESDAKVEAYQP